METREELLMSNYGEELENNIRSEQVKPINLDGDNTDIYEDGFVAKEKNNKKFVNYIKSYLYNKKYIMIFVLIIAFTITGIWFSKICSKPQSKYEEDSCYKAFVKDNNYIYYSYFSYNGISELMGKRGIYKVGVNSSDIVKISDEPAYSLNLYKNDIYYINVDDQKIYRIKKDGSGINRISSDEAVSLIVDNGFVYYRNTGIEDEDSAIFRMKLDGSDKKLLSQDVLTYNIVGNYIYYSSRTSLGDVYRIKTDGTHREKVCKINGILKYIKDDYIYYSMSVENPKSVNEFMDNVSHLNKVKLNGTNPTRLSDEAVLSFLVDKNNDVYYEKNSPEDYNGTSRLYKVNSEGKGETKLAEKTSQDFYIANDQVYYFGFEDVFPYRKDFKGGKPLLLLDIDEKKAEQYRNEIARQRTIPEELIEDFNYDLNRLYVVVRYNNGENKASEAYHIAALDNLIDIMNSRDDGYIYLTNFVNKDSSVNLSSVVELYFNKGKIRYTTFIKADKFYVVDKVEFYEEVTKKEKDNTVKYILKEKRDDSDEKGLEILNIDKKDVRS